MNLCKGIKSLFIINKKIRYYLPHAVFRLNSGTSGLGSRFLYSPVQLITYD